MNRSTPPCCEPPVCFSPALDSAVFASLFVARRVIRPLGRLGEGVERIAKGDMDFRVQLETGDEIEILAEEINKMAVALHEAYRALRRR